MLSLRSKRSPCGRSASAATRQLRYRVLTPLRKRSCAAADHSIKRISSRIDGPRSAVGSASDLRARGAEFYTRSGYILPYIPKGSCQLLRKYMHEVLINRGLGGLSLPRKSLVRLSGRPDMPIAVYRGRKTTTQQQQKLKRFTTLFSRFIQDATRRNLCPGLTRRLLSPRLPRLQTRVSKSCSQDSCPLIS